MIEAQKVLDILEKHGWRQGLANKVEDNRICLGVAIMRVHGSPSSPWERDRIWQRYGFNIAQEVIDWNDNPKRTWEDIKRLLEDRNCGVM